MLTYVWEIHHSFIILVPYFILFYFLEINKPSYITKLRELIMPPRSLKNSNHKSLSLQAHRKCLNTISGYIVDTPHGFQQVHKLPPVTLITIN